MQGYPVDGDTYPDENLDRKSEVAGVRSDPLGTGSYLRQGAYCITIFAKDEK